ncbi:MAG: hypothetical protein M3Y87_31755, partial [Myxococcota bacterium]|nr:hypothetical protein [Myxococcota bacterium]
VALVERAIEGGRAVELAVPDTTLWVRARDVHVAVLAGDGDGTGRLPRSWRDPVQRIRVVRARDVYAIEITAGERVFHTRVDAAGVRVDDSIRRRLEEHVPTWALLAILATFAMCAISMMRALAPIGALRTATETTAEERRRARTIAHARAMRWGLVLAPFALLSLIAGAVSIGWL